MSDDGEQLTLNFDGPVVEPDDTEVEPEIDRPSGKPGEFWNGRIWVSDADLAF